MQDDDDLVQLQEVEAMNSFWESATKASVSRFAELAAYLW